ncbi:MAG: DUF2786 domain-containing protein [Actinobacteria bacterium]|nr:DUF2786 domain-containing protein [Actinomycetota bacterium]
MTQPAPAADDRMVERISALLAKAESTDSEHEREALMAKAQQLAARHSIDLALAAAREGRTDQQPVVERIVFDGDHRNRNLKKHLVLLMSAVARANDVRMDVLNRADGVVLYGYPSDVRMAQAIWASLALQMASASAAWMRTGAWRRQTMVRHDRWGPEAVPMDARVARRSFYEGFVHRIGERLREARESVERDAVRDDAVRPGAGAGAGAGTALVLAGKRGRIADFYAEQSRARGTWRPTGSGALAPEASRAGRDAASRARLGTEHEVRVGRRSLPA